MHSRTLARIVRYLRMDHPIVLDEMNREEYFELIRAANYLEFRDLLDKLIPLLLTKYDLTDELLVELRGLIFPALFFLFNVGNLERFVEWILSRNVLPEFRIDIANKIQSMIGRIQWNTYAKIPTCNWAIDWAACKGYVEVVRLLLTDPRVDPTGAIERAAEFGHVKVVRLLLADPRVDPSEAIRIVAREGHDEVVRLIQKL